MSCSDSSNTIKNHCFYLLVRLCSSRVLFGRRQASTIVKHHENHYFMCFQLWVLENHSSPMCCGTVLFFCVPSGSSWKFRGPPGSSCELLGSPGNAWELLGAPGSSWVLLGVSGSSWGILGVPWSSWELMGAPGSPWELLGAPGSFWELLGAPGSSLGLHVIVSVVSCFGFFFMLQRRSKRKCASR